MTFHVFYVHFNYFVSIYRIAGNIGRELYLADWQILYHTTKIKSAIIAPTPGEGVAIVP